MPNLGSVLRDEIRRLARKEIRTTVAPMQKKLAEVRRLSVELKRKVDALQALSRRLAAEADARALEAARTGAEETKTARIGARSIRSQRKRFRLTREEFGRLVGVSANTVYLWESGKVTPRGKSRSALIGIRRIGAKEARRLIATSGGDGESAPSPRRAKRK